MYMWRELDLGEVRADFAHMRDLGFSVVRIFLLTEDFLPAPMTVPKDKVAALVEVARAARDEKLSTIPTLITINMSGKFWWPAWMRDRARSAREACTPIRRCFVRRRCSSDTCARALAGDASIRAFDLSNEIDDAQRLPSRDAGWLWAALLAGSVRRAAPGVPVQFGAHLPSLMANTHMRIDDLAGVVDEDCMHAYPLYCDVAKGFLDPELVPFACALTAELAGHRPRAADARVRHLHGARRRGPASPSPMIFSDSRGRNTSPPRRKARATTSRSSIDSPRPARPAPTPGVTATTTRSCSIARPSTRRSANARSASSAPTAARNPRAPSSARSRLASLAARSASAPPPRSSTSGPTPTTPRRRTIFVASTNDG